MNENKIKMKYPSWHYGYNTQHDVLTPHMTPCLGRPKKKKLEHTTPSSFIKCL